MIRKPPKRVDKKKKTVSSIPISVFYSPRRCNWAFRTSVELASMALHILISPAHHPLGHRRFRHTQPHATSLKSPATKCHDPLTIELLWGTARSPAPPAVTTPTILLCTCCCKLHCLRHQRTREPPERGSAPSRAKALPHQIRAILIIQRR